jgi:hypothetical protein
MLPPRRGDLVVSCGILDGVVLGQVFSEFLLYPCVNKLLPLSPRYRQINYVLFN